MIKLVAFDLDGTIGDTIPMCVKSFRAAVSPYLPNELSDEEIRSTFGLNEEGMIKEVLTEQWQSALDDFYVIYTDMHKEMCPEPFDGMREIVQRLREKGITTTLITGKGEKSCEISLRQFGMDSYFEKIATGSVNKKHTKAEALNYMIKSYGLHPDEMLYIGDDISDIIACEMVGVKCLSVAWATTILNIEKLEKHNHGNVLYTVQELKNRLSELIKEFTTH